MVSITPETFEHLAKFMGYGNPAGKYWFVGLEEGFKSDDDLLHEIEVRESWRGVEDVHCTRASLGQSMRGSDPTWYAMTRMVLKLDGIEAWDQNAFTKPYKEQRLGRFDGDTFMTDVLPLPTTRNKDWPYVSPFSDREAYEKVMRPVRVASIHDLWSRHKPQYVFCHGVKNWTAIKSKFGGDYVERSHGSVQIARVEDSIIVLTWNLGGRKMHIPRLGQIVDTVTAYESEASK